jgi:hypothetical protein
VEILNAQYEGRYGPRRNGRPCRVEKGKEMGDEIVVCADASGTSSPYRLPFPDERGAPGDRVSHVSEPPRASLNFGACCAEPSKLGETIGKIIRVLKGEDPE